MEADGIKEAVSSDMILARSALFVSLSRLVPVPFLDNYLVRRSIRHMVESLADAHGITVDKEALRPLHCRDVGCLWLILTFPFRLAWKLLLKLFKMVFLALFIYDIIRTIGGTILYGRTVERCLLDGRIPAGSGAPRALKAVSSACRRCRKVFKKVISRNDLYFMQKAFTSTIMAFLSGIKMDRRLMRILRMKLDEPDDSDIANPSVTADERGRFQNFVSEMTGILARPEMKEFLAGFDARYDAAWEKR